MSQSEDIHPKQPAPNAPPPEAPAQVNSDGSAAGEGGGHETGGGHDGFGPGPTGS